MESYSFQTLLALKTVFKPEYTHFKGEVTAHIIRFDVVILCFGWLLRPLERDLSQPPLLRQLPQLRSVWVSGFNLRTTPGSQATGCLIRAQQFMKVTGGLTHTRFKCDQFKSKQASQRPVEWSEVSMGLMWPTSLLLLQLNELEDTGGLWLICSTLPLIWLKNLIIWEP